MYNIIYMRCFFFLSRIKPILEQSSKLAHLHNLKELPVYTQPSKLLSAKRPT